MKFIRYYLKFIRYIYQVIPMFIWRLVYGRSASGKSKITPIDAFTIMLKIRPDGTTDEGDLERHGSA